jgi:hypothetical protein
MPRQSTISTLAWNQNLYYAARHEQISPKKLGYLTVARMARPRLPMGGETGGTNCHWFAGSRQHWKCLLVWSKLPGKTRVRR